jgi:hypothetical protein
MERCGSEGGVERKTPIEGSCYVGRSFRSEDEAPPMYLFPIPKLNLELGGLCLPDLGADQGGGDGYDDNAAGGVCLQRSKD